MLHQLYYILVSKLLQQLPLSMGLCFQSLEIRAQSTIRFLFRNHCNSFPCQWVCVSNHWRSMLNQLLDFCFETIATASINQLLDSCSETLKTAFLINGSVFPIVEINDQSTIRFLFRNHCNSFPCQWIWVSYHWKYMLNQLLDSCSETLKTAFLINGS